MMSLFELVSELMRSSISIKQLNRAGERLQQWLDLVFQLHPSLRRATNLHLLRHFLEDIARHGPVYGFWGFPTERLNYVAKHTNRAGGKPKCLP